MYPTSADKYIEKIESTCGSHRRKKEGADCAKRRVDAKSIAICSGESLSTSQQCKARGGKKLDEKKIRMAGGRGLRGRSRRDCELENEESSS